MGRARPAGTAGGMTSHAHMGEPASGPVETNSLWFDWLECDLVPGRF